MKLPLKPYQEKGKEEALKFPGYALFFIQGSGKSATAIAIVEERQHLIKRVLIVCPKSVLDTWASHLKKFASFKYEFKIKSFEFTTDKIHILAINYELLARLEKELKKWNPDFIIADESQRIKKRTSQASKVLRRLARKATYRLALSGTPMDNPGVDVWAQMDFSSPGFLGTWGEFTERFCRDVGFGYTKWQVKKRKIPRLRRILAKRSMRVGAEVLQLPTVLHRIHSFDLEPSAMRIYRELEEESIVVFKGEETLTTELPITKIVRLQQITGGYIKTDEGKRLRVSKAKLNTLLTIIPALKGKTVVFARFLREIASIKTVLDELCIPSVVLTGKMSIAERKANRAAFKDDPRIKVFISQIRTGGVGINELAVAGDCIFFSTTYSWIDYDQALSRLHRIGQKGRVTAHHLIARNTIDEDIYKIVRGKGKLSDLVMSIRGRYEKDS